MEKSNLRKGLEQGIGFFGVGLLLLALIIGIYAFVEPTSGPNINNVMTSFTQSQSSLTANNGQYDNRIPEGTYPYDYTEICFKNHAVYYDKDIGGSSTSGGNCSPGDIGFIIEQNENERINSTGAKGPDYWEEAKVACLKDGMRLPEPFEFKYACVNDAKLGLGLNSMTSNWEWASNFVLPIYYGYGGLGVAVMGDGSCSNSSWDWISRADGIQLSDSFRCAK